MKTVNWGIIGCGNVCEVKAGPPLYKVDGSKLLGVTRRDSEKGRDYARRHGTTFYATIDDLLAEPAIDTIYVATPDPLHEENTIAAAKAGKHVLCEKAMATSTAACDRMIQTCRDADVTLAVAYYRRCYPSILRAKDLLEQGVIGEVKTMYLNDEFPLSHRLDLVHFFLGDADHVWAREEDLPQGSHAPRGAMLHVVARNGKEAFTPVGWDEKLAPEILEFTGDKGVLRIDDLKAGKITIRVDNSERTEDVGPLPNTHWGLVDNFVKYQNGLAPLACDGVEGRKSTVILDIVQELQPDNKAIPVQYD